jgi:benzoate-CoA ligase
MRAGLTHPPGERFNFAQHLIERNAGRAGKPAYVDDHETMTYGELDERLRRMASALKALEVHREERVLLLMHDCVDWPVAFLGCLHAGVVPVAVNTLLSVDDYAYILEHSRAQGALVSHALMPTLQKAMALAKHEIHFMLVSRPEAGMPVGSSGLRSTLQAFPASEDAAPTAAEDIAFWLYSSGSTGRPKGTVHTHANPYWTAELYGSGVLGMTEKDFCYSAAKLFFAYGLGNALSFPLSVGASVLLMAERPTPDAVFRRLTEKKPTIFFGAPTGYAGMLASPSFRRRRTWRCGSLPRPARRCPGRSASASRRTSAAT